MFTGIIEAVGTVEKIVSDNGNRNFLISSVISHELKPDQSVSHDGVCLTVTRVDPQGHWVTAITETLEKSNLGTYKEGTKVNLERSMLANGRFDGHIVQGHVDQTGTVISITEAAGSWLIDFRYDPAQGNITVEKGSVSVNGVSLTCFNSARGSFRVAIIPFTYQNTGFNRLQNGDTVNLEFDIIGKYISRLIGK